MGRTHQKLLMATNRNIHAVAFTFFFQEQGICKAVLKWGSAQTDSFHVLFLRNGGYQGDPRCLPWFSGGFYSLRCALCFCIHTSSNTCLASSEYIFVLHKTYLLKSSKICSFFHSLPAAQIDIHLPVTFLWLLRSVSSTWVVQGQWQQPPTASYRDIWWSWALDLRPEDYFLEGWGKNYDVKSRGKVGNDVSCKKKRKHSNDLEKKILNICSFLVGHHN